MIQLIECMLTIEFSRYPLKYYTSFQIRMHFPHFFPFSPVTIYAFMWEMRTAGREPVATRWILIRKEV